MTSAEWTSCSACHELLRSRAFLFIVLRSAQHPQIPRFLQIFRGNWPMPLSLLNHSALVLFSQRTRIPTSARSIGFCAIWVCISSSSSSSMNFGRVSSAYYSERDLLLRARSPLEIAPWFSDLRQSNQPVIRYPVTRASTCPHVSRVTKTTLRS